ELHRGSQVEPKNEGCGGVHGIRVQCTEYRGRDRHCPAGTEGRSQATLNPAAREELLSQTGCYAEAQQRKHKLGSPRTRKGRIDLRECAGLAQTCELKDALQGLRCADKSDDEKHGRAELRLARAETEALRERL